ncbi:MAG: histidine kinase dimerization/phosphoacceptor domain -containing protein [Pseudomonadota bacterium]
MTDNPVLTEDAKKDRGYDHDDRFHRVVEHAPNAMILVDERGRIEMVNAETEQLFGYRRDELLGQPIEILVPARFNSHHADLRDSFVRAPGPRPMGPGRDLYALRKDGSEFAVEIGLNPIPINDGIQILAAVVDISDRKSKQETLEKSLQEKDLLLAEVHHRVKNNLQIIYSLLDMQSSQIDDSHAREMLRDSCNRVRSMAQIHQALYQSEDMSQVDFSHFFEELLQTLSASYNADIGRITVTTHIKTVRMPIGIAVPCGLIANELVSNALKHAFPGDRCGTIDIAIQDTGQNTIIMAVTDDGIGIPMDLDIENCASLGLQLIHLLTDQLGGTLTINRQNPTRLVIEFQQPD